MKITVGKYGAHAVVNGTKINFYYTENFEGVHVGDADYKWMNNLPDTELPVVWELMKAYHYHRLVELQLDNHLKPLFKKGVLQNG